MPQAHYDDRRYVCELMDEAFSIWRFLYYILKCTPSTDANSPPFFLAVFVPFRKDLNTLSAYRKRPTIAELL